MSALESLAIAAACMLAAIWTGLLAFEDGMNFPMWLVSLGFAVAGWWFAVRAKSKL